MPKPRRAAPAAPTDAASELIVITDTAAGLTASGTTVSSAAMNAEPIAAALTSARATIRPLFGATEGRVRHDLSNAAAMSSVPLPDLSVYYRVEGEPAVLEDLASRLAEQEGILGAYVKPPTALAAAEDINTMTPDAADAPPSTADFTARQGYLDPAPGGIDARFAWTLPGGRGAGVNVIDIEGAWRFDHEDLTANEGGANGMQNTDIAWRNHGTAVAGEFSGDENAIGITGICSDANVRGFSIFGGRGSSTAIRDAANSLSPGDIILVELHRAGPGALKRSPDDQDGFIAIEWWPDDFDAIAFATALGVIVVEAGGNGFRNLDDAVYSTPGPGFGPTWRNPFNRANRDSGAIMVGAGAPPSGTHGRDWGADRSRLDFSNWGSCIDAQGWGREVTTCGYGDLQGGADENLWYTDSFSGTSSASPIVVGALGCVQGVRRARGQALLTPATSRQLLRSTGSHQQDEAGRPTSQRIGNRPDLGAILNKKHFEKELIKESKELKEFKNEKLEVKERKELVKESKELKAEKNEKLEVKERKELVKEGKELFSEGKQFKVEKVELEGVKHEVEFQGKEVAERVGEFGLERVVDPQQVPDPRLRAQGIGQQHFIAPALRPDLGGGALHREEDLGPLTDG